MHDVRTFAFVFGVNDQPLIVRCDTDFFWSELAHVKTETKRLAAACSAILRAVVEHVTEIHLFQQVFAATPVTVVGRLQPEKVIAQARHL